MDYYLEAIANKNWELDQKYIEEEGMQEEQETTVSIIQYRIWDSLGRLVTRFLTDKDNNHITEIWNKNIIEHHLNKNAEGWVDYKRITINKNEIEDYKN